MAEDKSKVPVQTEKSASSALHPFRPFEDLRREIDRVFDAFGMWHPAFPRSFFGMEPFKDLQGSPAVDVTETDKAYEITAELPGLDEKNIDVKLANGMLTIKGEKQDEREERTREKKGRERRKDEREERTREKKGRPTTTGANAVSAHSSARFKFPTE